MATHRPRIYLAVILPFLALGVAAPFALVSLYAKRHGLSSDNVPAPNALLIGLPAFFLWIPFALLLSNFVLKAIRPMRKIAETFVSRNDRPGYAASQRQLSKGFAWAAGACIPLILLGWWI